ncbi:hypothetical protein BRADI_5g23795v3 [Brachypodium distachyon]|uniref:Uncharacterized protein n=1 Tax=Brachypodium distachyon TaxID=15368 RepID=A0A0Q3KXR6_BRADI|nr:hypothetical protein BRADI_5g23795v3 [Brachypodium distachyon]
MPSGTNEDKHNPRPSEGIFSNRHPILDRYQQIPDQTNFVPTSGTKRAAEEQMIAVFQKARGAYPASK